MSFIKFGLRSLFRTATSRAQRRAGEVHTSIDKLADQSASGQPAGQLLAKTPVELLAEPKAEQQRAQPKPQQWACKPGKPLPLGATELAGGVNFAVFSRNATSVSLVFFKKGDRVPVMEIVFDPAQNRTGDIWHVLIQDVDKSLAYGYRIQGPADGVNVDGHYFDEDAILLDPYARALQGGAIWGRPAAEMPVDACEEGLSSFWRRCLIVDDNFDWEGDRPLRIPQKDTIIYELHVRGYTVDESSGVSAPGTYRGLIEKIPYIRSLGVTSVELMPVFEFNELENRWINPKTGERLKNFWGYSTMAFFAPKASYAAEPWDGNAVKEFKEMVKAFHRAGIEIIIDVVFNHTAEGDSTGPLISFRGFDNTIYYILDRRTREHLNLSGCGNTVNSNHSVVQTLIIDCLRYWVMEMHVDGFRFDLAPILRRDERGRPCSHRSLVDAIEADPVLAHAKIIAEPWDLEVNQVGQFPGRWAEWNSYYREDVRKFIRGDRGVVGVLATRIAGSSDLYQKSDRRHYNSVNYVTCHDGFTLNDLVSYNQKHNYENGEDNRDGSSNNISSNCGVEGPTDDKNINELRNRRMKTMAAILMVSQGIPMVLAGDEFGRTQRGNNNPYCHDNEISWVNWCLAEENSDLLRFWRKIISLRRRHPIFRRWHFLTGTAPNGDIHPDLSWHSTRIGKPDWSDHSRVLAFLLNGMELGRGEVDDDFFVMINGNSSEQLFEIPPSRQGRGWYRIVDTGSPSPLDIVDDEQGELVSKDKRIAVAPDALCVLISRAAL